MHEQTIRLLWQLGKKFRLKELCPQYRRHNQRDYQGFCLQELGLNNQSARFVLTSCNATLNCGGDTTYSNGNVEQLPGKSNSKWNEEYIVLSKHSCFSLRKKKSMFRNHWLRYFGEIEVESLPLIFGGNFDKTLVEIIWCPRLSCPTVADQRQ